MTRDPIDRSTGVNTVSPNELDHPAASIDANEQALAEAGKTMPLGVGNFDDAVSADPLASRTMQAKRLDTGTVLIVVVVLVAGGTLFGMRTLARMSAGAERQTDVDRTVDKFLQTLAGTATGPDGTPISLDLGETGEVLGVLTEQYTDRQVPLEDVQRNPFQIFEQTAAVEPIRSGESAEEAFARQQREFEAQVQRVAADFVLQSVMMSSNPLASIDGRIVRIGQVLSSPDGKHEFRVSAIRPESVRLMVENEALDLTVEIDVRVQRD